MSIILREIEIGGGIPKIAVPIVEKDEKGILEQAKRISESCADIAEWRVDFYEKLYDAEAVKELLRKLRKILGKKLFLFTCRTVREGGEADCAVAEYCGIIRNGIVEMGADIIDVELSAGEAFLAEAVKAAHEKGSVVAASYHNFFETPESELIETKYLNMDACGADILKIALMPRQNADTDRLMEVSRKIIKRTGKPLIAISMGEQGRATRYAGEAFGSCITFGTMGSSSAPGQLNCEALAAMLQKVHEKLDRFRDAAHCEEMEQIIGEP